MDLRQKNILLSIYSSHFGNNEKEFIEYSLENNITNYQDIIQEFISIQNSVFSHILKITEPNKRLSAFEIENECSMFCLKNHKWINEEGLKFLNKWLIWMCWHEGVLKTN